MNSGQLNSFPLCIDRASATAAGTVTSQTIDTLGADYLQIPVWSSTADVVSNCPTVLKLQEADVTNTSSFADITAFVGGTATSSTVGFVIPADVTATQQLVKYLFNVDLKARKRYLRLLVSPATSQTFSALAILSRNAVAPTSLTALNVQGVAVSG